MKQLNLVRTSALIVVFFLSMAQGAVTALAQPLPPTLIAPANGSEAILPTFQ